MMEFIHEKGYSTPINREAHAPDFEWDNNIIESGTRIKSIVTMRKTKKDNQVIQI